MIRPAQQRANFKDMKWSCGYNSKEIDASIKLIQDQYESNLMNFSKSIINACNIDSVIKNQAHQNLTFPDLNRSLNSTNMKAAQKAISKWPGYTPTPLREIPELAEACAIKKLFYKDESSRFNLGSFKSLGGAYAVENLAKRYKKLNKNLTNLTVTTATDGNHGKSVAWGAKIAGCKAVIYIHNEVSEAREAAIKSFGAEVIRVRGNYEASLSACKNDAKLYTWEIVSDTSWEGYEDVPLQIMAGYSTIGKEIISQMNVKLLSHAFLPVGVGGLAAGVLSPLWAFLGKKLCKIISVESCLSACLLESISAGTPQLVNIKQETIMAGLSCGEVSTLAWDILKTTLSHSVTIKDEAVTLIMRLLATGFPKSNPIEAGECSTAGLIALIAISKNNTLRKKIGLNSDSVVLILGTEGATDLEFYQKVISNHH